MAKIKTGDTVCIISGGSKGMQGKIIKVDVKNSKVFVDQVNMRMRHVKASAQNPEGGKVEKHHPIHISNVAIIDPLAEKTLTWTKKSATRVGFRMNDQGKKVRYAKKSGQSID